VHREEVKQPGVYQSMYRSIFWTGYVMVLVAAFIPLKKDLHEITFNIVTFKFHFDQVLHVVVYFLICLYFLAGSFQGLTIFKENSFKRFILAVFILATITEGVQFFVPYRSFNFFDWLSNVVGICIGLVAIWCVRRMADG
jgi:VanZ family protein